MPLTGVHGRLYVWCVVCQGDRPHEHPSLSTHLTRAHGLDLVPGCAVCFYFRGRWSDVKKHVATKHHKDVDTDGSAVQWGLTKRDQASHKPTYSHVGPDAICPYPLKTEALSALQTSLVSEAKSQMSSTKAAVAAVPEGPELRRRRGRARSPVCPPEPEPSTSREARRSQSESQPATRRVSPRKRERPASPEIRLSSESEESPPVATSSPQKTEARRKKQPTPKKAVRTAQAASKSDSTTSSWETVPTLEASQLALFLDERQERVTLESAPSYEQTATQTHGLSFTSGVLITTDASTQTDSSPATRNRRTQATVSMQEGSAQTDISAESQDIIVVIPQGGGRLSLSTHPQ